MHERDNCDAPAPLNQLSQYAQLQITGDSSRNQGRQFCCHLHFMLHSRRAAIFVERACAVLDEARPQTFAPQVSSIISTMRGLRALAWLACVGACTGHFTKPPPRAAKQDAVNPKKTTRPVFELGFAGPRQHLARVQLIYRFAGMVVTCRMLPARPIPSRDPSFNQYFMACMSLSAPVKARRSTSA